jgi:dTDP-glucose pyrophosphorylase
MLVILPTAGIGSRLDYHTRNFNKAMVQIGDQPAISKIINFYPKNCKFVIILGYKQEHIKEYIKLVHSNRNIKFRFVIPFEGKKSSLTLTLKQAINDIKEPFYFHANDTIILEKKIFDFKKKNTIFVHKGKSDCLKYATVDIKKNKIYPKQSKLITNRKNYIGVSYIKDFKKFKQILKNDKSKNGELSFFYKLNPNQFETKILNQWFDIGSKETKEIAEKFFSNKNILPKNDQGIFFHKNKVVKFFTNPKIIKNRYKRSKILKPFVPQILKFSKYFYIYKYIKGKTLSSFDNKELFFKKFLNNMYSNFWKKTKLNNREYISFTNNCFNFYYEKTVSRINYLFERNSFNDQKHVINGKSIPKIETMISKIDWDNIKSGVPVNFHGDLHFENIIKNRNNFKLLDWREDFAGIKKYGDLYYDLAKINHGFIINHKLISKKNFTIAQLNKNKVKLSYKQTLSNKKCKKIFYEFLKDKKISIIKVELLTSLIYLNIAPLHHYPYSLFLYYLGKLELNRVIKKYI